MRGSHSPAHNATLVALLAKGLAEFVDVDGHAQVRITQAGSAARRARILEDRPPLDDATCFSRAQRSLSKTKDSEVSGKDVSRAISMGTRKGGGVAKMIES